jgi:hypothetical protein
MPPTENGNDEHDASTAVDNDPPLIDNDESGVNNRGERFSDEDDDLVRIRGAFDISSEEESSFVQDGVGTARQPWEPSGNRWRDMMYFVGPGKYVCAHIYIYIYVCVLVC